MSMTSTRTIAYRTCHLCEATCGLELHLEGDEIALVRGDKDDVFSHGYLCPKGTALRALEEQAGQLDAGDLALAQRARQLGQAGVDHRRRRRGAIR